MTGPLCAHCSGHGCTLCTQPRRTPAEALAWRLQDALRQLEQLAECERQGRCDARLAHDVAALLASASGAAGQIEAEHLHGMRRQSAVGRTA